MTPALTSQDGVVEIGSALVDWPVLSATPLRRGGNNRIFLLSGCENRAVLKFYPRQPEDLRDRLGQEFGALSFLTRNGIEGVPRPHRYDPVSGCAVYGWIEGTELDSIGSPEVDQLADFFMRLQELRNRDGAKLLPDASASCFSPAMIAEQLERRLARLREAITPGSDVAGFVANRLQPAALVAIDRMRDHCAAAGLAFAEPLPSAQRVFSASDFGFHNALRRPDGRLAFVDFEYFGWDDPAKAVADVMLHAGMALPEHLAQRFRTRVQARLTAADPGFSDRLDVFFPSLVVMWCLIQLNEFIPERWMRRTMAGRGDARLTIQAQQLQKAGNLLSRNFA